MTFYLQVITLMMVDVLRILKSGSKLFRKYMTLQKNQQAAKDTQADSPYQTKFSTPADHSILQVIQCNSVLQKLSANQRLLLESLAEGPR